MAIAQIEKMLNREKYSSIFEEVIFMGEDKYLKYIKENKKKATLLYQRFCFFNIHIIAQIL